MKFLVFSLAAILSSCQGSSTPTYGSVEIGRYRYIEPANGYPGMVLDTATGCVEQLFVRGEGKDVVVDKASVEFGPLGKDRACSASGITAIREGVSK